MQIVPRLVALLTSLHQKCIKNMILEIFRMITGFPEENNNTVLSHSGLIFAKYSIVLFNILHRVIGLSHTLSS
jgi:hypothetical protein